MPFGLNIILEKAMDKASSKNADMFTSPGLEAAVKRLEDDVLRRVAEEYHRIVVSMINNGEAGGPPLKDSTIARKGHSTKWLDSHELRDNIVLRKINKGYHVGIPSGATNSRGRSLSLMALEMEIGSLRRDARPVFGPARRRLEREDAKSMGLDIMVEEAFGL